MEIRPDRDPGRDRPTLRPSAWLRALRHHRATRPLLAAALVMLSLMAVQLERTRVETLRERWGAGRVAWVAATDLDAGHVLEAGDLVAETLPPAALPRDAVAEPPDGRRLADAVAAGEVIRDGRLGAAGTGTTGALVGPDRGAVALSTPSEHLRIGDTVDLYGLLDGGIVAAGAEVVAVSEGLPVVAVLTTDLPAVVRALTTGDVVPVVVG